MPPTADLLKAKFSRDRGTDVGVVPAATAIAERIRELSQLMNNAALNWVRL